MRLHRLIAPLVALLCVSLAFADEAPKPRGEKITLRLNLKKGDERAIVHRMDITSTHSFQGQTLIASVKLGMHLGAKVDDIDTDRLHTIKLTYNRITADLATPLGGFNYDSKEPDKAGKNPTFLLFNALIGQGVSLKVKPDGATQEVVGIDELAAKIQEKLPPEVSAKHQLEGMKSAFEQFAAYPDKPVDIGDTWKKKTKIGDPSLAMEVDATYTLVDRRNGIAVIKAQGEMTAKGMKGTSTGTFHMDEATGWVTAGEMNMDLAGEINGAGMAIKGKSTVGEK